MKIKKHHELPAYPNAAQFAASAKLLGLVTVASLGASSALADEPAPGDTKSPAAVSKEQEKPIVVGGECDSDDSIPDFMLQEGIHDYKYVQCGQKTLKEIVKMFYKDGIVDAKHRGKILPFDVDTCCALVLAANPALKLDSSGKLAQAKPEDPDNQGAIEEVLMPRVYKKTKEIHSAEEVDYSTHDYLYVTKSGDTLRSIVASFYKGGAEGKAPDYIDIPFDSDVACKVVAAANTALKLDSFETPLPIGTKLLLPKVYKHECGH